MIGCLHLPKPFGPAKDLMTDYLSVTFGMVCSAHGRYRPGEITHEKVLHQRPARV
jgi:hypothetical protein